MIFCRRTDIDMDRGSPISLECIDFWYGVASLPGGTAGKTKQLLDRETTP